MKNALLLILGLFLMIIENGQIDSKTEWITEVEKIKKITIPNLEIDYINEDLNKQKGILFYQGIPFSGKLIEKYPNSQLKRKLEFFEGKQDGLSLGWYPDGAKQYHRTFQTGEKDGEHEGWWPNGQMKFKYTFSKGIYIDELKEWHSNGQLYKFMHYDLSGKEKDLKMWDETGKIMANYVVRDGRRYGLIGKKSCYTVKDPNND